MIKYCIDRWNENREALRSHMRSDKELDTCQYEHLVKLVTKVVLGDEWDSEGITEIDNGDYQGTLLYLIPKKTYQPGENEYLMTYIGYGSCECCDTLLSIQDTKDQETRLNDFMEICKDIVTNMICPYNVGWRRDPDFDTVEYKE